MTAVGESTSSADAPPASCHSVLEQATGEMECSYEEHQAARLTTPHPCYSTLPGLIGSQRILIIRYEALMYRDVSQDFDMIPLLSCQRCTLYHQVPAHRHPRFSSLEYWQERE
jgi:hypothetical protein